MIRRYLPTLDVIEPEELAALQKLFDKLKTELAVASSAEEQFLAVTLMNAMNAGLAVGDVEVAARQAFAAHSANASVKATTN